MLSAVTPVSEASFSPLLPPLSPPPQAARVEATVAAARMVTRRREDLGNCSPLCGPGSTARRCGGGEGCSALAGAGPRPAGPAAEQPQADGPDEAGRREDHHDHQHDAVDER